MEEGWDDVNGRRLFATRTPIYNGYPPAPLMPNNAAFFTVVCWQIGKQSQGTGQRVNNQLQFPKQKSKARTTNGATKTPNIESNTYNTCGIKGLTFGHEYFTNAK